MDILPIAGLGLIAAVIAVVLRQQRPDIAMLVGVGAGIIIFFELQGYFATSIAAFSQLADRSGIGTLHMNTLLKVVGVSYITEFSSQACSDAGEKGIATKIELAGRLIILGLAIPIILAMLETVVSLVP